MRELIHSDLEIVNGGLSVAEAAGAAIIIIAAATAVAELYGVSHGCSVTASVGSSGASVSVQCSK